MIFHRFDQSTAEARSLAPDAGTRDGFFLGHPMVKLAMLV